jgi:hypothetical protein
MMTEGTDTYKGLAVPLFGDSEIKARTIGTDVLTLTGASGQAGDFIVCRKGGSEEFVVDVTGNVIAGSVTVAGVTTLTGVATYASMPIFDSASILTTAPTAAMTTGGIYIWDTDNLRTIGIAESATCIWEVAMTDN